MKIRRRSHPIDPQGNRGHPGSYAGCRMRRDSPDLYNRHGDPIDREEIQTQVVAATAHNREHGKAPHVVGHRWT